MVCDRCIASVKQAMEALGLQVKQIQLGEVQLETPGNIDMEEISRVLQSLGFTLLQSSAALLVKQVKELASVVYNGNFDFIPGFRFSKYAAEQLQVPLPAIHSAFIEKEGHTLDHFLAGYRVEKIKEMLVYTNGSLTDIAFKLGFSSVPHISKLFKSSTGLNPSHFREIRKNKLQLQHLQDKAE